VLLNDNKRWTHILPIMEQDVNEDAAIVVAVCPASKLPPEILVKIFKEVILTSPPITFLTPRYPRPDLLYSITGVCRRWRDVLRNSPECFIYVNMQADFRYTPSAYDIFSDYIN
jgi:hypothetical protein